MKVVVGNCVTVESVTPTAKVRKVDKRLKVLDDKGTRGRHVKAYGESTKSWQNLKVLDGNGIHGRHVKAYGESPES